MKLIKIECIGICTFQNDTQDESISRHSTRTTAHRNVVVYIANCILSTSAYTRIDTFVANTSSILGTIVI